MAVSLSEVFDWRKSLVGRVRSTAHASRVGIYRG